MPQATFESATEGLRSTGASVEEQELVDMLTAHAGHEEALLDSCERLAQKTASPAARYLMKLICEDERRHHRLLAELANAIAWESNPDTPARSVPDITPKSDGELMRQTRALLKVELLDRAELRRLKKRFRPYRDTTLWSLLVDVMLCDTEKHVLILRFMRAHLVR